MLSKNIAIIENVFSDVYDASVKSPSLVSDHSDNFVFAQRSLETCNLF